MGNSAYTCALQDFSLRMDALQMRRKELEDKEQQLEQSLQKFDKFLKENESRFVCLLEPELFFCFPKVLNLRINLPPQGGSVR